MSLWYLAWILLSVFLNQFVSRGILTEQIFFGVYPEGWKCCGTNSNESISNTSVSPLKEASGVNVSATDAVFCYKLRNVTMSVDSELKSAFSISFAMYLFTISVFRIFFKIMAGLCTSRKESNPKENPAIYYAKGLCVLALVYQIVFLVLIFTWPDILDKGNNGEVWLALVSGTVTSILLPFLLGSCEFGLAEGDIPWQYYNISNSETKHLLGDQRMGQTDNGGHTSNSDMLRNMGEQFPDSYQNDGE